MITLKKANWKEVRSPVFGAKCYRWGDVSAIVANEPPHNLWHISVSQPYRYPTWDEIYTAWYDLVPGAESIRGAIILPPKSEYVNVHPNCFHVYQLTDQEVPAGVLI